MGFNWAFKGLKKKFKLVTKNTQVVKTQCKAVLKRCRWKNSLQYGG